MIKGSEKEAISTIYDHCDQNCGSKLKSWEFKTCTACKGKFKKDQFRAEMKSMSTAYDGLLSKSKTGSQNSPSTDTKPDSGAISAAGLLEENTLSYYDRVDAD